MHHSLLFSTSLLVAIASVFSISTVFGSDELVAPGFVVIVVDDLGWADLSCYGSTFYESPQIDRLAEEGFRFTNGYASCPVCSPSRVSMQTGLNPARLGTTEWFGGPQPTAALKGPLAKKFKRRPLLPATYIDHLPLEQVTIAEVLSRNGYRTFFAGKWHLGGPAFYPETQGYQINVGGHEKGSPPGGYFSPYNNPKLSDGPKGEHLPNRLAIESVEFLQQVEDDPFFLFLSFYSVHNPQQGRKDLIEKYQAKAETLDQVGPEFAAEGDGRNRQVQNKPVYAAMVTAVDEAVGKVLEALRHDGLEQRTTVIFTSDNGGLSTAEGSPTSNLPLRAGKGWLYEGGIRVPWIIRSPTLGMPGATCSQPIISHDLVPTILELAGLDDDKSTRFDGTSIVPLLRGQAELTERDLYWHYPHYSNQGGRPGGAILAGKWKLIEWYKEPSIELYDLTSDNGEQRNLAECCPELAHELRGRLANWREQIGARMPKTNPHYVVRESVKSRQE